MKEYSKVIFETEEKDYFCLWFTDINSGFVTEEDHVACFRDEDVFDAYCKAKGFTPKDTMLFDLSSLLSFAIGKDNDFDASTLLNFWNICSDLAFTLKLDFVGDDDNETLSEIYDTLFFLETADDDEVSEEDATITEDDLSDLREIVAEGCKMIIGNLNAI